MAVPLTGLARTACCGAAMLLTLAAAGCGDDESGDASEATAATQAQSAVPGELIGTYAMTLKPADVPPNPPLELTDSAKHWTLEIVDSGGQDGPLFTIINDRLGILESSPLEVDGNRLLLHEEECPVAPAPVESEYGWQLSGETLRFTEVSNGCEDDTVLTLLTSEPWRKGGS